MNAIQEWENFDGRRMRRETPVHGLCLGRERLRGYQRSRSLGTAVLRETWFHTSLVAPFCFEICSETKGLSQPFCPWLVLVGRVLFMVC